MWQDTSANLSFRILNLQKRCLQFQRRPIIHYQLSNLVLISWKGFPLCCYFAIFSIIDVLCTQWYLVAMTSPSSLLAAFNKMPFQHRQHVATRESHSLNATTVCITWCFWGIFFRNRKGIIKAMWPCGHMFWYCLFYAVEGRSVCFNYSSVL